MAQHITRKLDHEKGKLRDKAQNPDFVESIREQGDNFDRGGIPDANAPCRVVLSFNDLR